MITDHAEGTLGSLRYTLGGDHPSQTTHHTMSPDSGLDIRTEKGGISPMTSRRLATPVHSLPPILHIFEPIPM